jgi:chromosome segregation ATPase
LQTTRGQLQEDLAEAELRIQSLETELLCARDQCADAQELKSSLQSAANVHPDPKSVAALEAELCEERQERAAMAAAVAQAETALVQMQAEVESVRQQWRAAVRDAQIARNSAATVLQEAEAEHGESCNWLSQRHRKGMHKCQLC